MSKLCLYLRWQPFEYGLLPFSDPAFVSSDATSPSALLRLRSKMHRYSSNLRKNRRINVTGISLCLGIMYEEAQLLLQTFASVAPPSHDDAVYNAPLGEVDAIGASIDDLVMFLYIQNYRRAPIRSHKDASLVEDVWPLDSPSSSSSSSSFSTAMTMTSTSTTVTTASNQVKIRKAVTPLHGDEEAHQLAYMQRHLQNLLSLLVAPSEDTCTDSQVLISQEQFNHLGFLIQSSTLEPLSQAAPFFSSESYALVPLEEVLDWVMKHLVSRSDHPQERHANGFSTIRDFTVIDGISKVSFSKDESSIIGGAVKVTNCNDSTIFILAPLDYASIYGCSDCTVVLGAVGKAVRMELCERVHLIVASVRICIANCRECRFNLAVNQDPVIFGENHSLQVAPYNTYYPKLETHLRQVGFDPSINKWDEHLTFSAVDPHESIVHAAGTADAETEGASLLPADHFTSFTIPKWTEDKCDHGCATTSNPFMIPRAYLQSLTQRNKAARMLREVLESLKINEQRKRSLAHVMRVQFKEWLLSSGNIRQLYKIQKDIE